MTKMDCPESIYGWHDAYDKDGKCCLCRRKVAAKTEMPLLDSRIKSELELAYDYYYNPDFGTGVYDTY